MTFNRFMIDREVIFDADANELHSLNDETVTISLNAPTARCLKMLLESKGKVISREEFLTEVWNARGIVVSQNTFYQNISLLRKSLEQAGLSKEVIVTVRQRGFVLASDIEITSCPHPDADILESLVNVVHVEDGTQNINKEVTAYQHKVVKKGNELNVSIWVLLLLIVMISINIILLIVNVIF